MMLTPPPVALSHPKILFWDLETSHNIVAAFQLRNQDWISPENIIAERFIISGAWKWYGQSTVHAASLLDYPDVHSDELLVQHLRATLMQADVIVAHNGDKFDLKYVKTRMLKHGLPPMPPILSIDTLKVAREHFMFNANRLDYLGEFLGLGRKKSTKPGLWLRALQRDPVAIREMVAYNKQDVVLLEKVFLKLVPYMSNQITRQLFGVTDTHCPRITCGSANLRKEGLHRAATQIYQRYSCNSCGGWFRDRKSLKSTQLRTL